MKQQTNNSGLDDFRFRLAVKQLKHILRNSRRMTTSILFYYLGKPDKWRIWGEVAGSSKGGVVFHIYTHAKIKIKQTKSCKVIEHLSSLISASISPFRYFHQFPYRLRSSEVILSRFPNKCSGISQVALT